MTEIAFLVEEDPTGGYTARASNEAIYTQADDLTALRANLRDAVICHFGDAPEHLISYRGIVTGEALMI